MAGQSISKYGLTWDRAQWDDALIERHLLRHGGYIKSGGKTYGLGLFQHYENYWQLLWPQDSINRWTSLILKEYLANRFNFIIGPPSSWKTGTVSRIGMMDYSLFPDCTGIIVSSTDMKGLERRVFGEMKMLWRQAYERYEWFPGNVIDHKHLIATDSIDEDSIRDVRNGIIGIPCKSDSGAFLGMGSYAGFKNRRVIVIGDEFQWMEMAMLKAQDNLIANGPNLVSGMSTDRNARGELLPHRGYKAVFIGNPNPTRPENPLHVIAEPIGGWSSIPNDGKTHVWDCLYMNGRCINLDGLDSPNNDYPEIDGKPRWVHLSNRQQIEQMERTHGKDSEEYWTNGRGVVRLGLASKKIITMELCRQFNALDIATFDGAEPTVKIGFCDAAYGGVGGDRCPVGWLEFGKCVDGVVRIQLHPMKLCTVAINPNMIPEDQIALFCKKEMEVAGVPPKNFFFDGRGSLALSLARLWSPDVNVVDFGGSPTNRPAGPDIYVNDEFQPRRLKTAKEHSRKFVSELWFAAMYGIQSDQVRGLYTDVILDAAPREYDKKENSRFTDIETKADMKLRSRRSPDLADAFVTGLEGARRRGFVIQKLSLKLSTGPVKPNEIELKAKEWRELLEKKELQNA